MTPSDKPIEFNWKNLYLILLGGWLFGLCGFIGLVVMSLLYAFCVGFELL